MRTFLTVAVLSLAACAAPNVQRRTPVSGTAPTRIAFDASRFQGVRAAADQSPPLPPSPTNGDAPDAPAGSVSLRSFTVTSETRTQPEPEPLPEPVRETATGAYDLNAPAYWYPEPRARDPWIPVNTVVGASFGAAYDATNCGHGYEGVLVGAGIGLVLDLGCLFSR